MSFRSARRIAGSVGAQFFDRPVDRRTSGASFELGSEESRLSLALAAPRAGKIIRRDNSEDPYLNSYSLAFSAASKENFGEVFKGGKNGGFADDLRISFSANKTLFRHRSRSDAIKAVTAAERGLAIRGEHSPAGANLRNECRKATAAEEPGIAMVDLDAKCGGKNLLDWINLAGEEGFEHPKARAALEAAVWGQSHPEVDVGYALSLGYRHFGYRTLSGNASGDLDASDALFGRKVHRLTRWPWEISAHLGGYLYASDVAGAKPHHLGDEKPWLYAAGLIEVGRSWKFPEDTEDQVVCAASTTVGSFSRCEEIDIARPASRRFLRFGGQARLGFAGYGAIPRIGVSPKVTYDVRDDQWAFDIPITLFADSDGKFNAGVRVKHMSAGDHSDEEPWSVGLFVGTAFKVTP